MENVWRAGNYDIKRAQQLLLLCAPHIDVSTPRRRPAWVTRCRMQNYWRQPADNVQQGLRVRKGGAARAALLRPAGVPLFVLPCEIPATHRLTRHIGVECHTSTKCQAYDTRECLRTRTVVSLFACINGHNSLLTNSSVAPLAVFSKINIFCWLISACDGWTNVSRDIKYKTLSIEINPHAQIKFRNIIKSKQSLILSKNFVCRAHV